MGKPKRSVITGKPVTRRIPSPAGGVRIETSIPWTLVKRGSRREVITPIDAPAAFVDSVQSEKEQREHEQHSPLLCALGLAHYWQQFLDDGKYRSLTEIAAAEGMNAGQVSRIFGLTQLSPGITSAILAGTSGRITLGTAIRRTFQSEWSL